MRIEVRGSDRKEVVGYLEMRELPRGRVCELPADDDEDDDLFVNPGAIVPIRGSRRMVALAVERRGKRVRHEDTLRAGPAAKELFRDIPEYAEEMRDSLSLDQRFIWPALVVPDTEVAEIVFDMHRFEPAGLKCSASHADAMWWATYEAGHRMPAPMVIDANRIATNTISPRHYITGGIVGDA